MSLATTIYAQFGKPHGVLGRLAGWIMANRGSNRQRNAWTIDLLDLKPDDRFLEIGYGPGLSLALAAQKITEGIVVGIDHSETMYRAATARNADMIRSGRIHIVSGGLERVNDLGRPFTKVMSANVVQFWPDGAEAFRKIAAVTAPSGTVATTYQPRHRGATAGDAEAMAGRITGWMEAAGFREIETHRLALEPLPVVCVTGTKA